MAFELPEAVTVAGQMQAELAGKQIAAAHLKNCDSLIRQGFVNRTPGVFAAALEGRTIESVIARGKWIFCKLSSNLYLLFALETGGEIRYHQNATLLPDQYHVRLDLADGSFLTQQIVGWGWAKVVREAVLDAERYPGELGPSPLDAAFALPVLGAALDTHANKMVKFVLIRQREVSGIGNGYLQDILFRAGIHPKRKSGALSEAERLALYRAIVDTMREAVRLGGRVSECDLYGRPGGYEPLMGRHGQPCPACGRAVEKLTVQGTASYVCPACQPLE